MLHAVNTQHGLQRIGFVAALSFIIARLNQRKPFLPRDDPLDLGKKLFFLCPYDNIKRSADVLALYSSFHSLLLRGG